MLLQMKAKELLLIQQTYQQLQQNKQLKQLKNLYTTSNSSQSNNNNNNNNNTTTPNHTTTTNTANTNNNPLINSLLYQQQLQQLYLLQQQQNAQVQAQAQVQVQVQAQSHSNNQQKNLLNAHNTPNNSSSFSVHSTPNINPSSMFPTLANQLPNDILPETLTSPIINYNTHSRQVSNVSAIMSPAIQTNISDFSSQESPTLNHVSFNNLNSFESLNYPFYESKTQNSMLSDQSININTNSDNLNFTNTLDPITDEQILEIEKQFDQLTETQLNQLNQKDIDDLNFLENKNSSNSSQDIDQYLSFDDCIDFSSANNTPNSCESNDCDNNLNNNINQFFNESIIDFDLPDNNQSSPFSNEKKKIIQSSPHDNIKSDKFNSDLNKDNLNYHLNTPKHKKMDLNIANFSQNTSLPHPNIKQLNQSNYNNNDDSFIDDGDTTIIMNTLMMDCEKPNFSSMESFTNQNNILGNTSSPLLPSPLTLKSNVEINNYKNGNDPDNIRKQNNIRGVNDDEDNDHFELPKMKPIRHLKELSSIPKLSPPAILDSGSKISKYGSSYKKIPSLNEKLTFIDETSVLNGTNECLSPGLHSPLQNRNRSRSRSKSPMRRPFHQRTRSTSPVKHNLSSQFLSNLKYNNDLGNISLPYQTPPSSPTKAMSNLTLTSPIGQIVSLSSSSSLAASPIHDGSGTPGFFLKPSLTRKRIATSPRSKTGCWTCRIRHKKCDETRPVCKNCSKINIKCDQYYDPKPIYMADEEEKKKKLREISLMWKSRYKSKKSNTGIESSKASPMANNNQSQSQLLSQPLSQSHILNTKGSNNNNNILSSSQNERRESIIDISLGSSSDNDNICNTSPTASENSHTASEEKNNAQTLNTKENGSKLEKSN
ncbi:Zn(II)2Cys6 transcription factor domain-containing protein ASCRUDRAFT_67767 [Ascoidea rubescens DSM 1968]|uniref:Zn(2)-C6 fungal-type domain-containing protein n=1 Tax=Ascoidea rubescens DSM 1968 TaxID=1344418 RepID=A0A1D2VPZ4_9ASCO|nr:hypothetical protein ASCRUDRAFT_67767 [Ascoidea rubescens DSM 1968]ODV63690.1 hypothetical protein ASCRUDRAFT_67767 [Ascoidea rubescens DSM 1968]